MGVREGARAHVGGYRGYDCEVWVWQGGFLFGQLVVYSWVSFPSKQRCCPVSWRWGLYSLPNYIARNTV